jgi:hypothetical protein
MHPPMRFAVPLTAVALIGALFPAAASAATPIAAGGSDLVPALVIAGAGALVIMLIMVLVPATRRGPGAPASTAGPDPGGPFRAHPVSSPASPRTAPETHAAPETPAAPESQPAPETQPAPESQLTPESQPAPETQPAPESQAAPESEPAPESQATPESQPAPESQAAPEPAPESYSATTAHPAQPVTAPAERVAPADEPAAAEWPAAAVALADPPRPASATPPAAPPASTDPAPDLLAALSPAAVLGEWANFEPQPQPEALRRGFADGAEASLTPDTGARALMRDHSLLVPIAACLLVGATVYAVRSRRRR